MNGIYEIIGTSAISLAALLIGGAYSAYIKRRVREYTAYLELLELMRRDISCSLATSEELGAHAKISMLEELGFLERLRNGESLAAAFSSIDGESLLSTTDRKTLENYFSRFGLGSLDTELRALESCISEFSSKERTEREGAPGRIKLAMTLLLLFAAAVLVLLI